MPSDLTPPPAFPILPRNSGSDYLDLGAMTPAPFYDFSEWLQRTAPQWFMQPGLVIGQKGLKKGQPVPAPGNPPSKGGSATEEPGAGQAFEGLWKPLLDFLTPSTGQKRDIAVYGLAVIVFLIAVFAILK